MPAQRKSILVIHPLGSDPAETRRLLGSMGYIVVTAAGQRAALKALGAVRFDIIFTSFGAVPPGSARSFVQELRLLAPGTAVVGMRDPGHDDVNEAWMGECDATIRAPLSALRVQWALDFELRYFGS